MTDQADLLQIDHGSVVAPAGCGKTQTITMAASGHSGNRPLLILTHTNAGVAALRSRLASAGVPPARYRLATIDGWSMRLIHSFPLRSGHDASTLELRDPTGDYPRIRRAAARLLDNGQLGDVLSATYARLIVDEYQDCSTTQHQLLVAASASLPTCVLGDPMQAIFGFGGDGLPAWRDVMEVFPVAAELTKPWRWINSGSEELGLWLLDARRVLEAGGRIDLRAAPTAVSWIALDGADDDERRMQAARVPPPNEGGTVLVLGNSRRPDRQRAIAGRTPGAVAVEAVDLRDFVGFADDFDPLEPGALSRLLDFASTIMVNLDSDALKERVRSLSVTRARVPASDAEVACLAFIDSPTHGSAEQVLRALARMPGVRIHRPAVYFASTRALAASDGAGEVFHAHAVRERERFRALGRTLPSRAVGSTLLLKGLEGDVAVILEADALDARNLYVAMTRGSRAVVVCSVSPTLGN